LDGKQALARIGSLLIILLAFAPPGAAQTWRRQRPAPEKQGAGQAELAGAATESRNKLVTATKTYIDSLEKVLELQRQQSEQAAALVEKRKGLLTLGVISKRELDESELALAEAGAKMDETRLRMTEAETMLTEAAAAEHVAKAPVEKPGTYRSSVLLIRYTGASTWALTEVSKVDAFFRSTFGKTLPVSAYGQTPTHSRLGFDHRHALDVAVHPDSLEGQSLIRFLRAQGLSFIAFRGALSGSATGAHIHIGPPSRRVSMTEN